jgi:hypothetical protein
MTSDTDYRARLRASIYADELAETFENGWVSFINNSQDGPLWVVFDGGRSVASFSVSEHSFDEKVVPFDRSKFGEIVT